MATSLCESVGRGEEVMQKGYKELLEGFRIGGREGDEEGIKNSSVISSWLCGTRRPCGEGT